MFPGRISRVNFASSPPARQPHAGPASLVTLGGCRPRGARTSAELRPQLLQQARQPLTGTAPFPEEELKASPRGSEHLDYVPKAPNTADGVRPAGPGPLSQLQGGPWQGHSGLGLSPRQRKPWGHGATRASSAPPAPPFFPEDVHGNAAGDGAQVETYGAIVSASVKAAFMDTGLTSPAAVDRLTDQPWQQLTGDLEPYELLIFILWRLENQAWQVK